MKKKTKSEMEKEVFHLLGEIRKACHIIYKIEDPKALEAWHILFDAHNDTLRSRTNYIKENKVVFTRSKKKHSVELVAQSK